MLKLFQSIFGAGSDQSGTYPAELRKRAIERAVEVTDPRIRAVPGYAGKLEPAVVKAIDHVVRLVESLPPPILANKAAYGTDNRLSVFFASAERMAEVIGGDRALAEFLASPANAGTQPIPTLLLVDRTERNVLGHALHGDQVQKDVAQVQVSFDRHRLLDPSAEEPVMRRMLMRRAFDHILTVALGRISELAGERGSLEQAQAMLRGKLRSLQSARVGFSGEEAKERPDPAALEAQLDEIDAKLEKTGAGAATLPRHLEILAGTLAESGKQLWVEPATLVMDRMGIKQSGPGGTALELQLHELHNAAGLTAAALPLAIARDEIRRPDRFAKAAQELL